MASLKRLGGGFGRQARIPRVRTPGDKTSSEVGISSISAVFTSVMKFSSDIFSPTPPHVTSVLQLPQILHSA